MHNAPFQRALHELGVLELAELGDQGSGATVAGDERGRGGVHVEHPGQGARGEDHQLGVVAAEAQDAYEGPHKRGHAEGLGREHEGVHQLVQRHDLLAVAPEGLQPLGHAVEHRVDPTAGPSGRLAVRCRPYPYVLR